MDLRSLQIKLEQKDAIIKNLEKRVGPTYVNSDSESRSASVSPVSHEVTQKDDSFAQNYTYTTNVSKIHYYSYLFSSLNTHIPQQIVGTIFLSISNLR